MNTLPRLRLYTLALHLYPAAFRARYAGEMLDAARHEYARSPNPLRFTASLAADTLRGALREHLRAASPTRPGYVAVFALFFTFLLLATSVVHQQILRRAADRAPARLAASFLRASPQVLSGAVAFAGPAQELSSPEFLNSTTTFAVLYDASGHALSGNATFHGALPQPPIGIFNEIHSRGDDEVTWQPQPGVRIALSGRPLPNGGSVVAGQSLIPSEARTARFNSLLRWMAVFCLLACCFLMLFSRKQTRSPTA